jgi:hypothetical protein
MTKKKPTWLVAGAKAAAEEARRAQAMIEYFMVMDRLLDVEEYAERPFDVEIQSCLLKRSSLGSRDLLQYHACV